MIVFDLDDTLYQEYDYVRSGFRAVSELVLRLSGFEAYDLMLAMYQAGNPDIFGSLLDDLRLPINKLRLIKHYREHQPILHLAQAVADMLTTLKRAEHALGIITDGRSTTQRNKIRALGLETWVDEIVISEESGAEKPRPDNFLHFEKRFPDRHFAYVGDNLTKDFLAPNRLGWRTVCILETREMNIHPQDFSTVSSDAMPQYCIERLA